MLPENSQSIPNKVVSLEPARQRAIFLNEKKNISCNGHSVRTTTWQFEKVRAKQQGT
jgi:hypothetical protein